MRLAIGVALLACAAWKSAAGAAYDPVPRVPESDAGAAARLFVSDSSTGAVIVVDIPSGEIVTRLATPPHVLMLGLGSDGRHLFAMRGRNTDRDTITIIDSGFDPAGQVRFPTIASTIVGEAPAGVRDGRLLTVGGNDAIFHEGTGEIEIMGAGDFASLEGVRSSRLKLAAPDQYHYLEAGKYLYVGYLAKGLVQIIDRDTGREAGRIGDCAILHGAAADPESGRLFFSCLTNVLVIGTQGQELNREVERITYPSGERVERFMKGSQRVLWGRNAGSLSVFLRLDLAKEPYQFQAIPVTDSIQQATTGDGSRLLVYLRSGTLEIRDGATGAVQHQLGISAAFAADYHEHVDRALLPGIASFGNRAWVTVPPEGVIVEIDLAAGRLLRRIETGGTPTRVVYAHRPTPVQ